MKHLATLCCLCIFVSLFAGCSSTPSAGIPVVDTTPAALKSSRAAVTPYDSNFLWNLKLGREFVTQGRFELAKEHFLLALASSSDDASRELVTHELNAVSLMIQTQR